MKHEPIDRRAFLTSATATAIATRLSGATMAAQQAVPNSAGTEVPALKAPSGACDCHHHVYDMRFPPPPGAVGNPFQPNARVEEYRLLQRRLGVIRSVVITPAAYVTDNRVTVDAIAKLGANTCGVALVQPDVTAAELRALADGGVRGVRFGMRFPIDMIEPVGQVAKDLGWRAQVYRFGDEIVAMEPMLKRLQLPIVFDHLGMLLPLGVKHPGFTVIRRLIDDGRAWLKLSGAYITISKSVDGQTIVSYTTDYSGATAVAQAFVTATPERVVWGSDWPHPGLGPDAKPNDATLFDLLRVWAPDDRTRHRILVENPETLYGFPKQS